MEDDARTLFRKIVKTISAAILWLMVNNIIGIYFGWMFFYDSPTLGNYIFYAFMLSSLAALLYYFYKVWKPYLGS
jgi:hypothetical protein